MEQTRCRRHRYVQCAFHRTEALYVAGSHSHIGQPSNDSACRQACFYTYMYMTGALGGWKQRRIKTYSPTVIASYRPFEKIGLNIRAFYKRDIPDADLQRPLLRAIGQPASEAGIRHAIQCGSCLLKRFGKGMLSTLNLTVDAYYNEVRDKIIATPNLQPARLDNG